MAPLVLHGPSLTSCGKDLLQLLRRNSLLYVSSGSGSGAAHTPATLGAFAADARAFFHPLYLFAALGTGVTDFGADAADLSG
jgi:hypothetical protein